jgi:hexosaminidase
MPRKNILWLLVLIAPMACAQIKQKGARDSIFSTFYQQRSTLFRLLPLNKQDIIFLGNSITNGNEWDELFGDGHIKNRGISGDITFGILNRLDEVTARKPAKIFLLIGINDLAAGTSPDSIAKRILLIAARIHRETPSTKLYVQSVLPVNDAFNKFPTHVNKGEQIKALNAALMATADSGNYHFINLYPFFCNKNGKLDTLYTNDGLHEKGPGYMFWKHLIYPYVYDLQDKPSLLPKPQSLMWTNDMFPLYNCHYIEINSRELQPQAEYLWQEMQRHGLQMQIINSPAKDGTPAIVMEQGKVIPSDQSDEAYKLDIDDKTIHITANTRHGCFNALQTLMQLARDGVMVPGVKITDFPAFKWRGYMIDVGRNYESVPMLEQQIEMMAKYKLNVFHLHLTEDIAWRLQINKYPQLTDAENMLRNAGAYYSVTELKQLIRFCKERFITLVPEIDMPGHSAAFRRPFKCDMQSDTGIAVIKNILKEVLTTYDMPYLHIGADEVKITNKNFIPEITKYVQTFGKEVIGWSPGGNLDKSVIRQLWMKDGANDPQVRYIDSRNLYINHMDPLESVPGIFNREIGDVNSGTNLMLGGELCLWPDRNVTNQEDILTMNPVYPAMLAFAERSWLGGGIPGWHVNIMGNGTNFKEFENRLVDQQKEYFQQIPFRYIAQSDIKWQLFGPYANKGNLAAKFAPEKKGFTPTDKKAVYVTGGTIILRHFWYPAVSAELPLPKDSTTYYALTNVFSRQDTTAMMWIGFYNISRSNNTSTPALNKWDDRDSEIWLNGVAIAPPDWKRAGDKGSSEQPLIDEGYEYRQPAIVHLRKGWNRILVKLPVSSFNKPKEQSPVKWMFTAVFVKQAGINFIADDELYYSPN